MNTLRNANSNVHAEAPSLAAFKRRLPTAGLFMLGPRQLQLFREGIRTAAAQPHSLPLPGQNHEMGSAAAGATAL